MLSLELKVDNLDYIWCYMQTMECVQYEEYYECIFTRDLQVIKNKVQLPPPGVFVHHDLLWDCHMRHYRRTQKDHVVMHCFIPM